MNGKLKRRVLTGAVLAILSMGLLIFSTAWAGNPQPIKTATGTIASVNATDKVIVLNVFGTFYPAMEIAIPPWAVKGARAGLSYRSTKGKNYYYEIVKPGEPFSVKKAMEATEKKAY